MTYHKILSGRFLLTLAGSISFISLIVTVCFILFYNRDKFNITELSPIINSGLVIISNIFTFYFVKNRIGDVSQNDSNPQ